MYIILNCLNHLVMEDLKTDEDLMGLKGSLEVLVNPHSRTSRLNWSLAWQRVVGAL